MPGRRCARPAGARAVASAGPRRARSPRSPAAPAGRPRRAPPATGRRAARRGRGARRPAPAARAPSAARRRSRTPPPPGGPCRGPAGRVPRAPPHAARQLVPAVVAGRQRQAGADELLEGAGARHGVDQGRRDEGQVGELGREPARRRVEAGERVVDERRQRAARAAQVRARGRRLAGQARGGEPRQRRPALPRREHGGLLRGARLLAEGGGQHRRDLVSCEHELLGAEPGRARTGGRVDATGDRAAQQQHPRVARRLAHQRSHTSIAAPSSSCASSTTRSGVRWAASTASAIADAAAAGSSSATFASSAARSERPARAAPRRRAAASSDGAATGAASPPPPPARRGGRRLRRSTDLPKPPGAARDPRGRRRAPRSGAVVGRVPVGGRARLHHTVRATGRSWDGAL